MTTVGAELTDDYGTAAQTFIILFVVIASILVMNLLIAILIAPDDKIHKKARNDQWVDFAATTFELSHGSRFMPAPVGIIVLVIAVVIHVVNFLPALISPRSLNIYGFVNHYQYNGLVSWRQLCLFP